MRPTTPYSRAVASKTLIAAVARILDPGCKVDTMTILEGEQGLYKSLAWRTLAGEAWFTDNLPDLHGKDAAQTLRGQVVYRTAELSQFQRSEIETVKSFLSRQSDHYRPSYGRRAATFPRQQVFVGTTNAEHYFKDRTGNRRYWPVTVEAPCDLATLQRRPGPALGGSGVRYARALVHGCGTGAVGPGGAGQPLKPDEWESRCWPMRRVTAITTMTRRSVYITTANY